MSPDPLHQLTPVEDFATFLAALKPDPGSLYVAAVAGPAAPVAVGLDANGYPDLLPSCSGGIGSADPGIRLAAFVDALPPSRARFFSFCRPDLSDVVDAIGRDLEGGSTCLTGYPRLDWSTAQPEFECVVEDRVPSLDAPGGFERQTVPPCQRQACDPPGLCCWFIPTDASACWYVDEDPMCRHVALGGDVYFPRGGLRLYVQRGTAGTCGTGLAAPGTETVVQCGTCAADASGQVVDCAPECVWYRTDAPCVDGGA